MRRTFRNKVESLEFLDFLDASRYRACMRNHLLGLFALTLISTPSASAAITVDDAQEIISVFKQEVVEPIQRLFGAQFEFNYDPELQWITPEVALSADRDGTDWMIGIFSGAPFHPKMTRDAFVVVICHEMGHHFGGAPFKKDDQGALRWSATEGQADYFATAVCAKRMLGLIPQRSSDTAAPKDIQLACSSKIADKAASALCARSLWASQNLAESLVEHDLPWSVQDTHVVAQTLGVIPDPTDGHYQYPSDACRMQTLRNGALCQQLPHPTTEDLLGVSGRERFCAGDRPKCWWGGSN
jgi:hypothetical protein